MASGRKASFPLLEQFLSLVFQDRAAVAPALIQRTAGEARPERVCDCLWLQDAAGKIARGEAVGRVDEGAPNQSVCDRVTRVERGVEIGLEQSLHRAIGRALSLCDWGHNPHAARSRVGHHQNSPLVQRELPVVAKPLRICVERFDDLLDPS